MPKRVCLEPDCPELIDSPARRCDEHERHVERARGSRQARGYDYKHEQLRRIWQRRLDRGLIIACWRCGAQIDPTYWHLGHDDEDRTVYRGPECVPCNTATAGR